MPSQTLTNSTIHAKRDASIVNNTVTYNNSYGPQVSLTPGPHPMTILQEHVAFGALHDSAERFDPPKCHPETRTAVLNCIDHWAKDWSDDAQPVLWLTGAAGAGKSAIAQTLTERWKKEGKAVLCFFFWRTSSERNQKTKLAPTLSYQLSKQYPSANAVIEDTIRVSSHDIFKKNLVVQFDELLVQPLGKVPTDQPPVIIVIDGLDECCVDLPRTDDFSGQDFKSQQREILDAVAFACQKAQSPRFLVVSRPEEVMRTSFARAPLDKMSHQLSLNNAPNMNEDIQLFLVCGFEEIRSRYPSLPSPWPSQAQVSELVRRSSGQFIYASIVVKYVTHRRQYPEKSLQDVFNLSDRPKRTGHHPLAVLDDLYALILRTVSTESLDVVQMVLGILCYSTRENTESTYSKLHGDREVARTPHILEKLLFLSPGEVTAHLTDLHSILHIPPAGNNHETIRIVHATLSEYLRDETRSGNLHIPPASFFPGLCLLTLQHLAMSKQEADTPINEIPRDEIGMFYYFSSCLSGHPGQTPCSKEVKNALWNFLEDEIGSYTSIAIKTNFNTTFGLNAHYCSSCRSIHYVDLHFKHGAVLYLLSCNTSTFEPSWWRRRIIAMRLTSASDTLKRRMTTLQVVHAKRYSGGHWPRALE